MNSLSDLKHLLREKGVEIIESQGWYFICDNMDRWSMLSGVCFLNYKPLSNKEVLEYVKNPPKPKKRNMTKMIRAKNYFEQEGVCDECESIEISI